MRLITTCAALIFLIAIDAAAQVYKCDNIWTTSPCSDPQQVINSSSKADSTPEERANREQASIESNKLSAVYHLRNVARQIEKESGITSVQIKAAEEYCQNTSTTLEDCRAKIDSIEQDLQRRSNERLKTNLKQQINEINKQRLEKGDKTPDDSSRANSSNQQTIIRIYKNKYYCDGKWRHRPCQHNRPFSPVHKPAINNNVPADNDNNSTTKPTPFIRRHISQIR